MNSLLKALLQKEWLEAIRDRRAIMLTLLMGLLGPIMIVVIFYILDEEFSEPSNTRVNIIGAEHAPTLYQFLSTNGFEHDALASISIIIDERFPEQLAEAKPAKVIIRGNMSNQNNSSTASQIESTVRRFSQRIEQGRLVARGIDPSILNVVEIQRQDTANPSQSGAILMESMMHLFIMTLFIGGMSFVIDSSAGERERHSLELLLMQPVSPLQVILSKALVAWALAYSTFLITLLGIILVFRFMTLASLGLNVELHTIDALHVLIQFAPLALLAVLFEYVMAFRAKSFKEAQSYMSLIIFIPIGIAMWAQFSNSEAAWLQWMPVLGQQHILNQAFQGEAAQLTSSLGAFGITTGLSAVLLMYLARTLRSEKTILGL